MFDVVIDALPLLAESAVGTIYYSAISLILGFPFGIFIAVCSFHKRATVRAFSRLFVSFFRSVPLLVLLLICYYALPFNISANLAAILALVIVEAAYIAEVIRGGLNAMPKGQVEAARMTGLSHFQTLRHIILPNVFKLTLPALVNEGTMAVKSSSLISTIGVLELSRASQNLAASTFKPLEIYLAAGAIYLLINFIIIVIGNLAETKLIKG